MKKFFAHAALAAAALFSVGAANAYVIDFEGATPSNPDWAPFLLDGDSVKQGPFTIGAYDPNNHGTVSDGAFVGSIVDGSSNCLDGICPGVDRTNYLASVDDGIVFLWDGGTGMKLSSFDASFLGPVSSTTTAAILVIEADYAGGFVDGFFSLKINKDGSTPFSHYLIGNATMLDGAASDFTTRNDLTNLFAYAYYCDSASGCTQGTSNKGQFGIDNINVTSVPEPSSWLLMGLGLVGVAAQLRRRRSI